MLRIDQVATVRRLLAAHHSQRAVHRLTGIARGSIARIAAGCRCDRFQPTGPEASTFPFAPSGPVARCAACGHRVQSPCLICRARRWSRLAAARSCDLAATEAAAGPLLGSELRGEHRARYEAIRARRQRRSRRASQTSGQRAFAPPWCGLRPTPARFSRETIAHRRYWLRSHA